MTSDPTTDPWEASYARRQNWLFWPNEELVRAISRTVRRRIGISESEPAPGAPAGNRFLDLGCGIGRHLVFGHELGYDVSGIDLSAHAVELARAWLESLDGTDVQNQVVQGDVRSLPWDDGEFAVVVSHGVLDSMHFEIAREGVAEVARVLAGDGVFYCDLIAGPPREEIVTGDHETGTVQSWFDRPKIEALLSGSFTVQEATLVSRTDLDGEPMGGRWHLILRPSGFRGSVEPQA